jgi:RNA 2',3'-cyclic 3'-phosphodiesterase
MRIFLAINPPPEVRRAVWDAAAPLRDSVNNIGWVAEAKIHLTLRFLGQMDEAAVPELAAAVTEVARTHAAPVIQLSGIGAFPGFRNPRVVWMGVEPEPRLELLHHDVEVACARLGFELEGRPFRPHLTLGRVRKRGTPAALERLRAAADEVRYTDDFFAQSLDVMESVPSPAGSTYRVRHAAPMKRS